MGFSVTWILAAIKYNQEIQRQYETVIFMPIQLDRFPYKKRVSGVPEALQLCF